MSCCSRLGKCLKLTKSSGEYTLNHEPSTTKVRPVNTVEKKAEVVKTDAKPPESKPIAEPSSTREMASSKSSIATTPLSNSIQPPSEASSVEETNSQDQLTPSDMDVIERRAGVPLQPHNTELNLDDSQIITHPKDKTIEKLIRSAILKNEFLQLVLDEDRLQKCIDAMYEKSINSGEFIIKEGDSGLFMYVSVEGEFEVTKDGMILKKFKDAEIFGELAILYNTKRFASVQALTQAKVYVLDRKVYKKIMLITAIAEDEENTNFIRDIPLFKDIHENALKKVGGLLKKEFFETGSKIVRQGDRGDKFYIIKGGTVLITKKQEESKVEETVGLFGKGKFFGERALFSDEYRQATVTAQAPGVECLTLDRDNFIKHLGGIDELKNYKHERRSIDENANQTLNTEYSHIKLEDLDIKDTLGIGGFGRVELARYRHDNTKTFALKYLKKIDIVLQQQQEHAYNEKQIMLRCNSDFICKLYNTYRDSKYIYFLMEVCLGGDLWTVLQKQKNRCFDEKTAKFMSACVIEAFDYLHKRHIIYRDLKPENLLLDSQGYVKIVDFGFAKILESNGKTYTFAGTPEYVAPEIILNRGHNKAVDYWALGIFIHELTYGKPPFRGSDHMKTYNMIIRGIDNVKLPEKLSSSVKMLIRKLCKTVPSDRLGCQKNGMDDIRHHKWFEKFDWNSLRSRKMPAPLIPKIRGSDDLSNFDKYPKDFDIPPDDPSSSEWDKDF